MSYTLVIPTLVQTEIADALDYYDKIGTDVGDKLFHAIAVAYNSLEESPQHYSYYGDSKIIRSLPLAKYPYCIIFRIVEEEVILVAFQNTHQNPERFSNRI